MVLLFLLLSACFNPDDILPLKGTVTSPEPVEGQVVRLLRETTLEANLSCDNAKPFKETTAGADGRYAFDVFRAQAQRLTGIGQFCFRVDTTFASGASAHVDVQQLFFETELPAIPDWRANASLEGDVVRFTPVEPLPAQESLEGDQLVHRARFVTSDGGVAWVAYDRMLDLLTNEPVRVPVGLGPLALEDFTGGLELEARLTRVSAEEEGPFGEGGSATTIALRAETALPLQGARTPVSRGLDCPPYASPCPLTDGALTRFAAQSRDRVTLTLPTPRAVTAVVLRGVETGLPLMGVLLDDGDGGTTQVQHALPTSAWGGAPQVVPIDPRDAGFDPDAGNLGFTLAFPPTYSTVQLDGGVVKSMTFVFPRGLEAISEISVFE